MRFLNILNDNVVFLATNDILVKKNQLCDKPDDFLVVVATSMFLLFAALKVHDEDTTLLETWYMKDTNVLPATYRLQPISSILHHYNDKASSCICLWVVDLYHGCIYCHLKNLHCGLFILNVCVTVKV